MTTTGAEHTIVEVGTHRVGYGQPPLVIAGPDVIESQEHAVRHAQRMKDITDRLGLPFVFKCSYDKGNRTSGDAFRGPGITEGLKILDAVKRQAGVLVLSDIHCRAEVEPAAAVLDVIQIPAYLSRQTDFLVAAAQSGKVLHIKKGQFLAPWDMEHVIAKVVNAGNTNVMVAERGTMFGYNNLVSDMRSLPIMRGFGYPVIFDGTHSVQLPGGRGESSGGQREFIPGLVRAACAMGCDGIFLEVHEAPASAPCDGPNMLKLDDLERLLTDVKAITAINQTREA